MCITFCHVNKLLFTNHQDCTAEMCNQAEMSHPSCVTCIHDSRDDGLCSLTMSSITGDGCCHHNQVVIHGEQTLDDKLYELFPNYHMVIEASEQLSYQGIPFYHSGGQIVIDPDKMPLPEKFGEGTDH